MPLESPLAYNMYLFNLWIADHTYIFFFCVYTNHILIKNCSIFVLVGCTLFHRTSPGFSGIPAPKYNFVNGVILGLLNRLVWSLVIFNLVLDGVGQKGRQVPAHESQHQDFEVNSLWDCQAMKVLHHKYYVMLYPCFMKP